MKKKLAIVLAVALLCIMAVGTTLTYFTDTTEVDTNTMAVGNVKIEQVEDFDAGAKLLPYNGDPTKTGFTEELNAVTKAVTVKNIGSEAAYIRTLFAFEGVKDQETNKYVNPVEKGIIHVEYNTDKIADTETKVGAWAHVGSIKVGEVDYFVYSFTYSAALAAGTDSVTPFSLKAIALDCNQGNEFYNNVGTDGKYNILVLSQAVQTAGFTGATAVADAFAAAFPLDKDGEGNATVIPTTWFPQTLNQG